MTKYLNLTDFKLQGLGAKLKKKVKAKKPLSSAEYRVKHGVEAWQAEVARRREASTGDAAGHGMTAEGKALTKKYQDVLAKHIEDDKLERHSAGVLYVFEEVKDLPVKLLFLGITVAAGSKIGVDKNGRKTYHNVLLWLGRHIHQEMRDVESMFHLGAWCDRMLCKLPFFAHDEDDVLILKYSDSLRVWLDEMRTHDAGRDLIPSEEKPAPWTQFRQGDLTLVTGRYSEAAVKRAIDDGHMSTVLESINSLQSVGFTINIKALDIARQMAPKLPSEPPVKPLTRKDEIVQKQQLASARAKVHNYHHDMVIAETLAGWDVFYNQLKLDSRSRVYSVPHFSYLLSDHARGVINFARPLPIGKEGMFWLMAGVADLASKLDPDANVKAMTFDARADWTVRNLDMIRAIAQTARQGVVPDKIMKIKKPIRLVAACIELDKALDEGLGFETRLPISFDCSCSALQHYAAMTRAEEGELANLGQGHTMFDPYILVAGDVYPDNRALMSGPDDREMIKEAAVGLFYRSKAGGWKRLKNGKAGPPYGMTAAVVELLQDRGHMSGVGAQKLATDIYHAFEVRVPAAMETLEFLVELSNLMSEAGKPLCWPSPLNFPVVSEKHLPIKKKIAEWIDLPGFNRRRKTVWLTLGDRPEIDTRGAANAVGANYVHSYDASMLHMIARNAGQLGIDLVTAHDCFACHAPNAGTLYMLARQCFVSLHVFSHEFRGILAAVKDALPPGTSLPGPPSNRGELNLLDFLTNDFAIS